MASIQANLAKYFIRQLRQRSLAYLNNIQQLRIEQDKALSRIRPPKNVNYKTEPFAKFSAEWAIPATAHGNRHPDKVIMYLHGGGYAIGSAASHRGLVGKIVAETGIRALSLDYRLAPENPFPAALEDSGRLGRWRTLPLYPLKAEGNGLASAPCRLCNFTMDRPEPEWRQYGNPQR
jgi:acetyl esterase/lipase